MYLKKSVKLCDILQKEIMSNISFDGMGTKKL